MTDTNDSIDQIIQEEIEEGIENQPIGNKDKSHEEETLNVPEMENISNEEEFNKEEGNPTSEEEKSKEEILEQEPLETLNVSNSDETVVTSNRSEEDKMAKPYN